MRAELRGGLLVKLLRGGAVRAAGQVIAGRGGLRAQSSSPRRALIHMYIYIKHLSSCGFKNNILFVLISSSVSVAKSLFASCVCPLSKKEHIVYSKNVTHQHPGSIALDTVV